MDTPPLTEPPGIAVLCWVGLAGGVAAEILAIYKLRDKGKFPTQMKTPFWWLGTIGMILFSPFVVWLHAAGGAILTVWLAFHVGAATPVLIAGVTAAKVSNPIIEEDAK